MKPQIIRADTIDLQDPGSPSAKDHTRQPTNPAPLGDGPPAPHQAIALKNAGLDGLELHHRSPRGSQDLSNKELQLLHEHSDADEPDGADGDHGLGIQRDGEGSRVNGQDGDVDDEGDESMDDDMMDKISSSPPIDDGGYPRPWPLKGAPISSAQPAREEKNSSTSVDLLSSPPFAITLVHLPLSSSILQKERGSSSEVHHQKVRYSTKERKPQETEDSYESEEEDQLTPLMSERRAGYFHESLEQDAFDADFDADKLNSLLLPAEDPLLDTSLEEEPCGEMLVDARDIDDSGNKPFHDDSDTEYSDDDTDDISFADSRFVDSGWGGQCLRETEDIDFEFVYALHTFVATVDGQANATKGDTMVLLDDSNSYWWLVRVVKDSSIGYLPAEHIETPTERLARLNKHRNIDLSQTMLGDNPEKSRNPLKKAMRRRNAKTVQFTEPTYYEPSENDYTTEEEHEDDPEFLTIAESAQSDTQTEGQAQNQSAVVEPLKVRNTTKADGVKDDESIEPAGAQIEEPNKALDDRSRITTNGVDHQGEPMSPKNNRKIRNTDSFFKDDSIETRKMNLTPVLLRDDSSTSTLTNGPVQDAKARGSLDNVESPTTGEKPKDEKRKEKKSGMLSGLFKRKDRKSKAQSDDEDPEWLNKEIAASRQSPPPKTSLDSTPTEGTSVPTSPQRSQPQRQSSKLQKAPPGKSNSISKRPGSRDGQSSLRASGVDTRANIPQSNQPPTTSAPENPFENPRFVELESKAEDAQQKPSLRIQTSDQSPEPYQPAGAPKSPTDLKPRNVFSPIKDVLRPAQSATEPKPEKTRKATSRMTIEDSDSSPEEGPTRPLEALAPQQHSRQPSPNKDRLSESPVQVSPMANASQPPPLVGDSSSQDDTALSPASPSSTPELVERPIEESASARDDATNTPSSTVQSSRQAPEWSDAGLRSYLDGENDIKDLMLVVHDTSSVKPPGPDHPVIGSFSETQTRLRGMESRLDGLLQDLLARKAQARR